MRTKKQQQHTGLIKLLVVIGDCIWINLLFVFMLYLSNKTDHGFLSLKYNFAMINMAYFVSLVRCGIILDKRIVFTEKIIALVAKTVTFFAIILSATAFFVSDFSLSAFYLFLYFTLCFIVISIWRVLFRIFLKSYRSKGGNTRSIIILGAGRVANRVYNSSITNLYYGYRFLGFFDDREEGDYCVNPQLVRGRLDDVVEFIKQTHVDEIICALPAGDDRKALPILQYAENNLIRFMIVPDFMRFISRSVSLSFLDNSIPIVSLMEEPLRKASNQLVKRLFDMVFSLCFIVTIFPLVFIVLAPIIKFTSKGPIFFKQKRTGENGETFNCLKFRTMKVNEEADSTQAKKDDDRITKIGAFMRRTNLDEIPQFFNVLIGDMSVVGPRPHMLKHTEMYSQLIDKYMLRHFAKPGITGWAQVTGYRGETKELSEMEGRVQQDVWYIENWSLWLDVKIIFMTIRNMISGDEKAY